ACAGSDGGGAAEWVAAAAVALCDASGPDGCSVCGPPLAAVTPIAAHQTSASAVTSVRAGKPSLREFMNVEPLNEFRRDSGRITGSRPVGCNSDARDDVR